MQRLKFVVGWILIIISSSVMIGNIIVAILHQHMLVDFWILLFVMSLFLYGSKLIPMVNEFILAHSWLVLIIIVLAWLIPDMMTTPDFSYNPTRIIWK